MNHGTWNNPVTPPDVYSRRYAFGNDGPRGVRYTAADGVQYRIIRKHSESDWLAAICDDDPAWVHQAPDWQTLKEHLDAGAPR